MTPEKGKIYKGTISNITNFGAFVEIESEESDTKKISGMIHISEVSKTYVKDIKEHLKVGQEVNVLCLGLNDKNKYSFSIKQAEQAGEAAETAPDFNKKSEKPQPEKRFSEKPKKQKPKEDENSFEAMMSRFKRISEDKICDIKRGTERRNNSRRK